MVRPNVHMPHAVFTLQLDLLTPLPDGLLVHFCFLGENEDEMLFGPH